MKAVSKRWMICCGLGVAATVRADLTTQWMAYYPFDEAGETGLANQVPGATQYHATRGGTLFSDWAEGPDATGPGFAGKADFNGTSGTSDRSSLLAGGALNLDDGRSEYVRIPIGSTELGANFTISCWHALTPGPSNDSNRYHVFEAESGYDVSWGTSTTTFTTPQPSYPYVAYIGQLPTAGFGPSGMTTQEWHHVAHVVSAEGGTTTLSLYVDGVFFGSRTVATSEIAFPAMVFGRHRLENIMDRDWDGMIDEVGIWGRSLSKGEVFELYHRGKAAIAMSVDLASEGQAFIGVSPSNPVLGQVTGAGIHPLGSEISIEAVPAPGYAFASWSAPFDQEGASFTHTVAGPVLAEATFVPDTADSDGDGLSNYDEVHVHHTSPDLADTDGDGISDGDELLVTGTNPLVSQLAAVNYILEHLCEGGAEGGEVLERNPETGMLRIKLKLKDSPTLQDWQALLPSLDASATPAGPELKFNVSGNGQGKRFLQVEATKP